MEKLNEVAAFLDRNPGLADCVVQITYSEMYDIAEAFRGLEQRAEAAEALNNHLELAVRKAEAVSESLRRRAEDAENKLLFTRPAPAVSLAEMVPDESALADKHIEWLSTLQRPMFSDEDWEELTLYTWLAFRDSARVQRAAILRNIEKAK